jgi:hypothetical protein
MLLKGIPTMTAAKAVKEQHVVITIRATLERPRSCPVQVSCFISFKLVCAICIVVSFEFSGEPEPGFTGTASTGVPGNISRRSIREKEPVFIEYELC